MKGKVSKILKKDKVSKVAAYTIGIIYFIVYLISIENIIFGSTGYSFSIAEDWNVKLFQQRISFLLEPIASLNLGFITFLISVPNILLGMLLGFLVGLNVLIGVFSYRKPKICNIKYKYSSIIGFLPALLTGFACCVPTFLIALGPLVTASFTVFFIEFRVFLIPISILLMLGSFVWMLKKVPENF